MGDSETPDLGDLSNQKVHIYTFRISDASFPNSLAYLLHGVSDTTVKKSSWDFAARGLLIGTPLSLPPSPISVALGYQESFAFVIRCLC